MWELLLWFGFSLEFAIRHRGHVGSGSLTFQFVWLLRFRGFDGVVAFDPYPSGAGAGFCRLSWRVIVTSLCWSLRGS